MSGSLRNDLYEWFEEEKEKSDLVLAMGTLSGMSADEVVSRCGKRCIQKGKGLGAVIVGFQQTKMDKYAALRVFGRIDRVMELLVEELCVDVLTSFYVPCLPLGCVTKTEGVFCVPYDSKTGKRSEKKKMMWLVFFFSFYVIFFFSL